MAVKTVKKPPQELDEGDRLRISHARAVLQEYGLYVDVAEMSDTAYEQRLNRTKALELAIQFAPMNSTKELVLVAGSFYDYIWKGDKGAEV